MYFADKVDSDDTLPMGAVSSRSTKFAVSILSISLSYFIINIYVKESKAIL